MPSSIVGAACAALPREPSPFDESSFLSYMEKGIAYISEASSHGNGSALTVEVLTDPAQVINGFNWSGDMVDALVDVNRDGARNVRDRLHSVAALNASNRHALVNRPTTHIPRFESAGGTGPWKSTVGHQSAC